MLVGSCFSGIGGIDLAFERAGARVIFNCDIDERCRQVLRARWPGVPRFKDMRTVTGDALRATGLRPDILVGGFPCQDLSVAGARAGLAGERSGLFFEFARVLDETKPRWFLLENVPGLLSSAGGRDMGVLVSTLVNLGYGISWRVLDAQYFGVAQRRRRVFVVGHLGSGARAASVLFEPEGSGGDPPARRAAGQAAAGAVADGVAVRGFGVNNAGGTDVSGPFGSNGQGGLRTTDLDVAGAYVVRSFSVYPESGQGADLRATEIDVAPAISVTDGEKVTDRGVRVVSYRKATKAHHPDDWERWEETDRSDTLTDRDGTAPATAVVQPAYGLKEANRQANGWGIDEERAYTLDGQGRGSVAAPDLAVRRLTPLECLRLQGFPDWWLDGLDLPDSAKYRMVGNAVAVPVVEWIAKRMMGQRRAL